MVGYILSVFQKREVKCPEDGVISFSNSHKGLCELRVDLLWPQWKCSEEYLGSYTCHQRF